MNDIPPQQHFPFRGSRSREYLKKTHFPFYAEMGWNHDKPTCPCKQWNIQIPTQDQQNNGTE